MTNTELLEALTKALNPEDQPEVRAIQETIEEPTTAQLSTINELIGRESSAEEWLIVPYMASNNFVDVDYRRWHKNALVGMGLTYKGRPLILDHAWGNSDKTVSFIFDAKLVTDEQTSNSILNAGGFAKFNKQILKNEGYVWLYLAAAVAKTSDAADAIMNRQYQDCSTGSDLQGAYMICPNCSEVKGREVTFTERDKNDEYICPHDIPSRFMHRIAQVYGIDANFADYATLNGVHHEAVELSNCIRGALPAAGILRN